MARTILNDPQNPPPRRDRSSSSVAALAPAPTQKTRTTPEERKLWLQQQDFIEPSSVKANSVLCRSCCRIIKLDNRYRYHIDAWKRHYPRCPGLTGRKPRKQGSTASSAKRDIIGARKDEEIDAEHSFVEMDERVSKPSENPLPSSQLRYYGYEDFEEYVSERGRRERSCSLPISYVRDS